MAYLSFTPTGIGELLSQIDAFAGQQLGWTSSWSGGVLSLTPKVGGPVVRAQEGAGYATRTGPEIIWEMDVAGTPEIICAMSHMTSTSVAWLHGGNTPEPWLLVTVLTDPGIYRHAYIGNLTQYGTWSGGLVLDAVDWAHDYNNTDPLVIYDWAHQYNHMLFSHDSEWSPYRDRREGYLGGLEIGGIGSGYPIARFCFDDSTNFPDDHPVAGGGYQDNHSRAATDPGVFPASGEAALVPITIFVDALRNATWTPAGHITGLRMVNIDALDPEGLYTYAGLTWRIFPLCRKTSGPFNTANRGLAVLQEA